MRKLPFAHLFSGKSHDPAIELAEKLKEIAPVPISKVFFCKSGSEANDTPGQARLVHEQCARPAEARRRSSAGIKGYHGVTVASASLTGLPNNQIDFDLPIASILHTSCPHHYRFAQAGESEEEFSTRLAAELEELIVREGPETVAAFIAEPVMGAGGVIVPPYDLFREDHGGLREVRRLLIADEVICGFGRLGAHVRLARRSASSRTRSRSPRRSPPPMCRSAAVMVPEAMYQAMLDESRKIGTFGHGFTYSGHPVAAAVALKTLEIYARDRIVEAGRARRRSFRRD